MQEESVVQSYKSQLSEYPDDSSLPSISLTLRQKLYIVTNRNRIFRKFKDEGHPCSLAFLAGFNFKEIVGLHAYYIIGQFDNWSLEEIRQTGISSQEFIAQSGFDKGKRTLVYLRHAGYSFIEAMNAIGDDIKSLQKLLNIGYTISDMRDAGISWSKIRKAGGSCTAAKAAGFQLTDNAEAGYNCKQVYKADFPYDEARDICNFSLNALKLGGYSRELIEE